MCVSPLMKAYLWSSAYLDRMWYGFHVVLVLLLVPGFTVECEWAKFMKRFQFSICKLT